MHLWPVSNPSVTIQSMCTLCMRKGPTLCRAWKEGKQHQFFFHRICYYKAAFYISTEREEGTKPHLPEKPMIRSIRW